MKKKLNFSVASDPAGKTQVQQECLNDLPKFVQLAVEDKTQRKESLEKTLKGESISMEQIVERLKQERMEAEKDYRQYGKDEGFDFAKTASYADLKYAACTFEPAVDGRYYFETSLMDDKILGEYFQEYFDENPELYVNCEAVGDYQAQFLNNLAEKWIDGWLEGVREFYYEIEEKL
jgi:hypothetical protein